MILSSLWHNDDGGCVYTNVSLMNELQASLEKKFAMKRVDEPADYLGLLVKRDRALKRVEITQPESVQKFIEIVGADKLKTVRYPLRPPPVYGSAEYERPAVG